MEKIKPHSEVASQAILGIAKSFSFNSQKYIPKDGASFSLVKVEILSGLTVALALVPEAIAFAFVAGVAPLSGLYAAFIVGLITAVFGGRPGMISGATGALAGQGMVNIKLKNYDKAKRSYQKAQEIYPSMKSSKVMIEQIEELIKRQSI